MSILKKTLDKYKKEIIPINIEKIIKENGGIIDVINLGKIDGITIGNHIGINKKLCSCYKRFTLAHELCHLLLTEKSLSVGLYHSLDYKEKRADRFATKILLPKKQLLSLRQEYQNIPDLVNYFGVPSKVIIRRLNKLLG